MQYHGLFFIIISVLVLSSCALPPETAGREENPALETPEAGSIAEGPSREAVFIYNQQKTLARKISLKLGSEPLLFPSGYLRLTGVVDGMGGREPIILVEIGGRGLALGVGEGVDGYQLISVSESGAVLAKKGE